MKKEKKIILILMILCILGVSGLYIIWNSKENNLDDKITFTFDSNGGSTVKIMKLMKGAKADLPTTVREGYIFKGWYVGRKKYTSSAIAKKNTTFKAEWDKIPEAAKTYTITFDSTGGNEIENLTVECEKEVILPEDVKRDGYTFITWIDDKSTPIQNGAILSCEDVTLYAKWKKNEPEKALNENKEYTCPSGYTLNGAKCIAESEVITNCPEGTKEDGPLCIQLIDHNKGTRVCKEETVILDNNGHTYTGSGEYFEIGLGICGYYIWDNLKTESSCRGASDKNTVWSNGKCYAKTINNNYITQCSDEYQYYSSNDLSTKFGIHDNGGCFRKIEKNYSCEKDYTLDNGKCLKIINATTKKA